VQISGDNPYGQRKLFSSEDFLGVFKDKKGEETSRVEKVSEIISMLGGFGGLASMNVSICRRLAFPKTL